MADDVETTQDELRKAREARGLSADGDPLASNGSSSISDRAAEGEAEEDAGPPPPPPLPADKQLTLAGLAPRGTPIESVVSIMSAEAAISGLLEADQEVQLIVTVRPNKYEYVPVREDGEVKRYKLRQQLRVLHVAPLASEAGQVAAAGNA